MGPGGAPTEVTLDEAVDFAVRCGGQLMVARQGLLRSRMEEVEAFLDMDRHLSVSKAFRTVPASSMGLRFESLKRRLVVA